MPEIPPFERNCVKAAGGRSSFWRTPALACVIGTVSMLLVQPAFSQDSAGAKPSQVSPPATTATAPSVLTPDFPAHFPRPNAPVGREVFIGSIRQEIDGSKYKLRGSAMIELPGSILKADEIDYDEETGDAEARGNVFYQDFEHDQKIVCDKADYNVHDEKGKFYNPRGYSKNRVDTRPGVLTSNNPFYFEGEFAERVGEKYLLHNGFITGCKIPEPWWSLTGPLFDIVPDQRAIARNSVFHIRHMPLFFTPFFYKSLEKLPRKSGFLTPTIGNSSKYGFLFGFGYYWAINRSYDATYKVVDFTQRGIAHHLDFRGKPSQNSDFDAIVFGVQDRGIPQASGPPIEQGGLSIYATGRAAMPWGFQARGVLDYLSSLTFREAFTESYNEAVFAQTLSKGVISKEWSTFTFAAYYARLENFQDATIEPNGSANSVIIAAQPEIDFASRDHQIGDLPLWFSLQSSYGLFRRSQPAYQTRQFSPRSDFEPNIATVLHWHGFHLFPEFTLHETNYAESFQNGNVTGTDLFRNAQEIKVTLVAPGIERTFNKKTWLGDKLKHVVEPRAYYRYVTGVDQFLNTIRFDDVDLLSDTSEVQYGITNRLYSKRGDQVDEILTWDVSQSRFFNPSFGGAVVPGERNEVLSSIANTAFAFMSGPRHYSPIVSRLRASPKYGWNFEWRTDYDPLVGRLTVSVFSADVHFHHVFLAAGHNFVNTDPGINNCAVSVTTFILSPCANQVRGLLGFGDQNRRGWNGAVTAIYDYRQAVMQFATTQVTYNTDCCGFSVQYRRYAYGNAQNGSLIRNDNQFRVAFNIANVGSVGTLKRQERLF